jgi:small basic protein (TIGR04137 family)
MSVDKSLRSKNMLERHRNVLSRAERIMLLKETNVWTDDTSPYGLPKAIHRKAAVGKKDKAVKKDEEAGEGEAAVETEEKK